jgi:hypothetical protein
MARAVTCSLVPPVTVKVADPVTTDSSGVFVKRAVMVVVP